MMNKRVRAQSGGGSFAILAGWIGRVARLDFSVFDEVRGERTATASAVIVVLGASMMAGLGSWIWGAQHEDLAGIDLPELFLKTVIAGGLIQTGVWFAWVYVTYMVLARAFGAPVLFGELIRVMGLAFAPVALSVFVGIAPLAVPFGVFSLSMAAIYTHIAIEQTAEVTPREAVLANLAGIGTFLIFMGAFANVAEVGGIGGLAPGILFFSLDF